MKPTISDFRNDQPDLKVHSSSVSPSTINGGTIRMPQSRLMPSDPGSRLSVNGVATWKKSRIGLKFRGAFQPPRKTTAVSAERMNTFTYSAKKKKPKRMPLYSVAKPATISLSASVKSNGLRLPSAVAAMKKIRNASGCWKTNQLRKLPDWRSTIVFRLSVPVIMITPTTERVSGIS